METSIRIERTAKNKISLKHGSYVHLRIKEDVSLEELSKILAWASQRIDAYIYYKNKEGVMRAEYTSEKDYKHSI